MQQTIDTQHSTICQLNRNMGRLLKENRELHKRLSTYEDTPKDSNNSSTPPTKDPLPTEIARRTKSLRQKSDKPIGGQKGHPGTTRKLVEYPDETERFMAEVCSRCGQSLEEVEGVLEHVTQEIDLPSIHPILRERRFYKKVCTCGCSNSYAPRGKGGNAVTFGENIRAIATYLSVVQCVPYQRLQSLFSNLFNIEISQGTLANIIREMLDKSKPAIGQIENQLKESKVAGFDESGCYCKGKLNWSWIAQTTYLTLVFRQTGRGAKVLEERFGDSLKNMIAVTDRHAAYFTIDFLNNQVCLAHLLRNLEYLNGIDKEQTWAKQVQQLLREAIHTRKQNPRQQINPESWIKQLDILTKQNIDHLSKEFNQLRKGIVKCRDFLFNFLDDPDIPADNNASERGIRKLKIKQKISGAFRSENGADAFHAIHSITDTAWKNGQSQIQAILNLY
ncbi:MAG: IS66 family transposase [Tannerella sp.]|jgi:hypothetical protein|nr:IS66 family transposase [Tannerella sp.]